MHLELYDDVIERRPEVKTPGRTMGQWLELVVAGLLLLAPWVVCNWVTEWIETNPIVQPALGDLKLYESPATRLHAAGFPWVYYRNFEQFGEYVRFFYWHALAGNALVILGYVLVMARWLDLRRRNPRRVEFQFSISDLFYFLILISPLLYAWSHERQIHNQESRVAKQWANVLTVSAHQTRRVPIWLPQTLADILPLSWHRFESAEAVGDRPELIQDLKVFRHLHALRFREYTSVPELLKDVAKRNAIFELHFYNLDLGSVTTESISEIRALSVLELESTEFHMGAIAHRGGLPNLRHFLATDTYFGQHAFEWNHVFPNLESIQLPLPLDEPLAFHLHDFPELSKIRLNSIEPWAKRAPLQLHLVNLPKLLHLQLSTLATIDLKLKELPMLEKVELYSSSPVASQKTQQGQPIPIPLAADLSHAVLEDLERLKQFDLYVKNTKSFHAKNTPSLKTVGLAMVHSEFTENNRFDTKMLQECVKYQITANMRTDPYGLQAVIDGLGEIEPLEAIDASYVPLMGVDFSPLKNLHHLKILNLENCFLKPKDIVSIGKLSQIEELKLGNNYLVRFDTRSMPGLQGLKTLKLNGSSLPMAQTIDPQSIVVQGLPNLETVQYTLSALAERVVMRDLPKANIELSLSMPLQHLELVNLPMMTRLGIEAPLPKSAIIADLPKLEGLSLRHPSNTDATLKAFKGIKEVRRVNVGTTSISKKSLIAMGRLPKLTALAVDHTETDDQVVRQWTCLPYLKALDISSTRVTDEGLIYILENSDLERLILNDNSFQPETIQRLIDEPQLTVLGLRGVPLDAEHLEFLKSLESLKCLDLSETGVDSKLVDTLVVRNQLRVLILESCLGLSSDLGFLKTANSRKLPLGISIEDSVQARLMNIPVVYRIQELPPRWREGYWASMALPASSEPLQP